MNVRKRECPFPASRMQYTRTELLIWARVQSCSLDMGSFVVCVVCVVCVLGCGLIEYFLLVSYGNSPLALRTTKSRIEANEMLGSIASFILIHSLWSYSTCIRGFESPFSIPIMTLIIGFYRVPPAVDKGKSYR